MPPVNTSSTILASAWLAGSTDFQQNVPFPSQARMAEVIDAFNMPNAGRLFQEVTGLFTTIGETRIKTQRWENPLSFLESGFMSYGANVREIAFKWAKAHSFDSNSQTLLKRKLARTMEVFHQLDRFDRYDVSVSRSEFLQSLQPGIGADGGTGLDTFLGGVFDSIYSPEAYDSMRYTLQTIAEADNAWGLMRENTPAVETKADGEKLLAQIEALMLRWKFPSTIYNNVDELPVFADISDIVVFVQPETLAQIDQVLLANLFAGERSEDIRRRIVVVPDFPIPNVRAIVADRNFFVIHRSLFSLENFYNPEQITTKYYLHSQGVWSASPLANIVLLGDFDSTQIPTVTVAPTSLVITPDEVTIARGGMVHINADLRGTVTGNDAESVAVKPDSVIWDVSISGTDDEQKVSREVNRNTYIDRFGNLHVQKTGVSVGDTVTVNATSTYINPSGETQELAASPVEITIAEATTLDGEYDKLVYTDKNDATVINGDIVDTAAYGDNR